MGAFIDRPGTNLIMPCPAIYIGQRFEAPTTMAHVGLGFVNDRTTLYCILFLP